MGGGGCVEGFGAQRAGAFEPGVASNSAERLFPASSFSRCRRIPPVTDGHPVEPVVGFGVRKPSVHWLVVLGGFRYSISSKGVIFCGSLAIRNCLCAGVCSSI